MVLRWIIKPKPKTGFESRYLEIKKQIESIADIIDTKNDMEDTEANDLNSKLNDLIKEIDDNTISKYETAQSPKLGDNKSTDQLIVEKYYTKHPYNKIKTLNEFYKDNFHKYYCEFSLEDSIGNSNKYGTVELDFIANIIANSDFLSTEIKTLSTQQNLSPQTMDTLSNMIESEVSDISDNKFKKKYLKAVKWLRFWSSNGHYISAYEE
jgi:hypothetical protein